MRSPLITFDTAVSSTPVTVSTPMWTQEMGDMMQIAVPGGTGVLGSRVVTELATRGHTVRVLSRHEPAQLPPGAEHYAVDIETGVGLSQALDGVETVVDTLSPHQHVDAVLIDGVGRLLAAEREAGTGHHVAISIVGCDRIPFRYYRAKVTQEDLVQAGPIPWTLLRSTQFHELVDDILGAAARFHLSPHGSQQVQPVDVAAVAAVLADAAEAGPSGRLADIGGPTVYTLTQANATRRQHIASNPRLPVWLPPIGRVGWRLHSGALCLGPGGRTASFDYAQWLDERILAPL